MSQPKVLIVDIEYNNEAIPTYECTKGEINVLIKDCELLLDDLKDIDKRYKDET